MSQNTNEEPVINHIPELIPPSPIPAPNKAKRLNDSNKSKIIMLYI